MSATALQVAMVLGVLVGQLTVGIPLALRLNRREQPRRARRATEALADAAAAIIEEWPDDRAAMMLAAWRAERGRRPVLRVGRDARSGAASRGVMPRATVHRGITDETPSVPPGVELKRRGAEPAPRAFSLAANGRDVRIFTLDAE